MGEREREGWEGALEFVLHFKMVNQWLLNVNQTKIRQAKVATTTTTRIITTTTG